MLKSFVQKFALSHSENEEDSMPMDDELLDVAEEFALADEYHYQLESDVGEEYVWGQH